MNFNFTGFGNAAAPAQLAPAQVAPPPKVLSAVETDFADIQGKLDVNKPECRFHAILYDYDRDRRSVQNFPREQGVSDQLWDDASKDIAPFRKPIVIRGFQNLTQHAREQKKALQESNQVLETCNERLNDTSREFRDTMHKKLLEVRDTHDKIRSQICRVLSLIDRSNQALLSPEEENMRVEFSSFSQRLTFAEYQLATLKANSNANYTAFASASQGSVAPLQDHVRLSPPQREQLDQVLKQQSEAIEDMKRFVERTRADLEIMNAGLRHHGR